MRLYLDDCADSNLLVSLLLRDGHAVETPRSAGTRGQKDEAHLVYAGGHGLALITKNPRDFWLLDEEWARSGMTHSGILLMYEDNIRGKDMEPEDIARAINRLVASGITIQNQVHILNHWR